VAENLRPIFLFSLPRSGSTLLQRLLGADDSIATTSEPWILLPHIYALRPTGVRAEYNHHRMVQAATDFVNEMPGGMADYEDELRRFILGLYRKAAGNERARYFLDKTPRYHVVSQEIIDLFPTGKFIFLWRNPLSVVSSMISTFGGGRWVIYAYKVDLFNGLSALVKTYVRNKDNVLAVRYEDLVAEPELELRRICEYLEVDFHARLLEGIRTVSLSGRMGDPTGTREYLSISAAPVEKYKATLHNRLRKSWCRHYLAWIGRERLATMGYESARLYDELRSTPTSSRGLFSDGGRFVYGMLQPVVDFRRVLNEMSDRKAEKRFLPYR